MLSANPVLTTVGGQMANEGSLLNLPNIGTFTDVVESSGSTDTAGLNIAGFSSIGAFDPASNVVFNTDTLMISGGFTGMGTVATSNVGFGAFQIAVFAFSSFELDAGRTITAVGSRPLALLSHSNLSVAGTIDVSAPPVPVGGISQQVAGAGGGNGGDGTQSVLGGVPLTNRRGFSAAGAPVPLAIGDISGGGFPAGAFSERTGRRVRRRRWPRRIGRFSVWRGRRGLRESGDCNTGWKRWVSLGSKQYRQF